ncbi:efflux transporter outer membrane subunit [Aurantiacibacter luteus]|uniref:Transporter n=1 Tax=Aurantiacibacter luteus TaxID=1581420 RepID=A0A0G9MX57_9SPHN|nr:TolC family protein [Aurantiacibacter luteus]KLE33858.1 transporter [Aurantiacibacter luteus]
MTLRHTALAAVSALALAACATTPADEEVATTVPVTATHGAFVAAEQGVVTPSPLPADWWRLYDDPVLDALVADAAVANTDVRQSVARIARARAVLRGARADRMPQGGLSASAGYGRTPVDQTPPGADRTGASFGLGADLSYELDLFGRVSGSIAATQGDLAAAQADADAVRVIAIADTTQAYASAASAAARIATARSIVALLDDSLRLTRRRHEAGLTDGLAVARIEALRQQRAATIPAIEAERTAALFALATLTGRAPSQLPPIAGERALPLEIAAPIPVGDGAQLLARRPDVRAAEQRLLADNARIGVAHADLYPRITLGGSVGSTASSLGNLFSGGPLGFLLGPLVDWALPNREPVRARIDAAGADADASLAAFDGTVLTALQETETALSDYARALEQRQSLVSAQEAAARAARITRAQNREGLVDSLQTLDAERTLAEAQAALADQDALVSKRQITLFRALGGGWSQAAAGAAR